MRKPLPNIFENKPYRCTFGTVLSFNKNCRGVILARCYICDSPNANFRRTVHTGISYGGGINSRGTSYSSARAYYGKRSVCAKCAFKIDYNEQKQKYYWSWLLPSLFLGGATVAQCLGEAEWAIPLWIGVIVLSIIAGIITYIGKGKVDDWAKENYYAYFPKERQEADESVLQNSKVALHPTMTEDYKNNFIEISEKMLKACSEQTNCYVTILKNEFDGINGDFYFEEKNKDETLEIFENKYCKIGFIIAVLNIYRNFIVANLESIKNFWKDEIKKFPQDDVIECGNKYIGKAQAAEKYVNCITNNNTQILVAHSEKIISFLKSKELYYIVERIPHFLKMNAIGENYQLLGIKDRFVLFYDDTWRFASPTIPIKIKGDKISINEKFMTEKEFVEYMTQAEILKQDIEARPFLILFQSTLLWTQHAVDNTPKIQESPISEELQNEFDRKMSDEEQEHKNCFQNLKTRSLT